MNTKAALLISALVVSFAGSGCTATKYVPVAPQCSPPPPPALPAIDRGALWDNIGDARYREIETYIDRLWAYSDEQAAMLKEVCGG